MYAWKVNYTAKLADGREIPNQEVRHVNFWRAAAFIKNLLEKDMIVKGSTKYIKII